MAGSVGYQARLLPAVVFPPHHTLPPPHWLQGEQRGRKEGGEASAAAALGRRQPGVFAGAAGAAGEPAGASRNCATRSGPAPFPCTHDRAEKGTEVVAAGAGAGAVPAAGVIGGGSSAAEWAMAAAGVGPRTRPPPRRRALDDGNVAAVKPSPSSRAESLPLAPPPTVGATSRAYPRPPFFKPRLSCFALFTTTAATSQLPRLSLQLYSKNM